MPPILIILLIAFFLCIQQLYNSFFSFAMNAQQNKNDTYIAVNGETTGLGFANRDEGAKNQEDQGVIEFIITSNDQKHQSMKKLLDLKNIFSRQLPKMPKQYIVKLVFDRNHESMVILKNGSKVIGGICYRIYPTQKFAEIAFLAITATEQVKGYGTRLMNKYKQQMQKRGIEFLMTYADNFALGYFRKQGFTKDHKMNPQRWKGFIKDYEGGTMMECYIHPRLNYSKVSQIIKSQKNFVIQKIKELSINQKKYNGSELEHLIEPYTKTFGEDSQETFNINPELIPGVLESGWTWNDYQQLKKTKERSFQLQCQNIIDSLKKHKSVWPFMEPVSPEDVPDYFNIIKDPIDIKTIEKKLLSNQYQDKESFTADIMRIFTNCRSYNQVDTVYYKCSKELEEFVVPLLQALKEKKQQWQQSIKERKGGKQKMPGAKKKIEKKKI